MKEIELTQGYVAVVDDEDYEELSKFKWYANKVGWVWYAKRNSRRDAQGRRKAILMHQVILGCASGQNVDHRDGNGLNNTRKNLRVATTAQNNRNAKKRTDNKTGFKGVSFYPKTGKFKGTISLHGKDRHLGYFRTPEEAHLAYCVAAKTLHGSFARFQ